MYLLLVETAVEELQSKSTAEDLLKKITIEDVQSKIGEGLRWLEERIKKPKWAAGLYLQWGLLLT